MRDFRIVFYGRYGKYFGDRESKFRLKDMKRNSTTLIPDRWTQRRNGRLGTIQDGHPPRFPLTLRSPVPSLDYEDHHSRITNEVRFTTTGAKK